MNKEEICNDGKCKRIRMGDKIHLKHLNEKTTKKSDKNTAFRSPNQVQLLFFALIILGGIITFLTNNPYGEDPLKNNPILKITYTVVGIVLFNLAFAVLSKGNSIHTEDRIRRIENKLDRILEHRDNVFQNKE